MKLNFLNKHVILSGRTYSIIMHFFVGIGLSRPLEKFSKHFEAKDMSRTCP